MVITTDMDMVTDIATDMDTTKTKQKIPGNNG